MLLMQLATSPGAASSPTNQNDDPLATTFADQRMGTNRDIALGLYQPPFPNDLSGLTDYERASGRPTPIVHWFAHWGDWKSAFSREDLEAASSRGSIPMITWEPWKWNPGATAPDPAWSLHNGILSGKFDDYIDSWARGMAIYGKPILLRFAHEMHNNSIYPWAVGNNGNTAEEYVAAWRHVHDIFARYNTTNVKWVWNPHTIGDASAETYAPVYSALYPGDDYVDWLGLDIYNTGPSLDWGAPYWRTFSQVLAEPYKAITAVSNKPLILPEVGCTEATGAKGTWISSALDSEIYQFPRVQALVWFDVDKEQDWQLHSSPSALSAWLSANRSNAFTFAPQALL
jgi:beta-mannanase